MTLIFYYNFNVFSLNILELGISELGNCLQAKGAPDACISFFKTGNGKEACIEGRMNRMMDHINQNRKWPPNWNTCFEEDILKQ